MGLLNPREIYLSIAFYHSSPIARYVLPAFIVFEVYERGVERSLAHDRLHEDVYVVTHIAARDRGRVEKILHYLQTGYGKNPCKGFGAVFYLQNSSIYKEYDKTYIGFIRQVVEWDVWTRGSSSFVWR